MKKILIYCSCAILLSSAISSCKKKSDDPTPAAASVTLKATDGNVSYDGNGETKTTAAKGQLTSKNLVITGTNFTLQIDTTAGIVGTYNLTQDDFGKYVRITTSTDYFSSYGNTGQIVITAIDRVNQKVSGYFQTGVSGSTGNTIYSGDFKNVFYTGASSMSATINGSAWTSTSPDYEVNNGQLNIDGNTSFFSAELFLNLRNVTAPGTYQLTKDGDYRAVYYSASSVEFTSTSGQVVITTYDTVKKVVKGTFSYTGIQTSGTGTAGLTVTNGKFNIQMP